MQIGNSMQHSLDTAGSCTNRNLALQPSCEHAFTSVIVCTLGSRPSLEQCLASLVAQNCSRCEILVVFNAAHNDEFVERLVSYPVRVLSEPKRGVSAARNRAVLAADVRSFATFAVWSGLQAPGSGLQRVIADNTPHWVVRVKVSVKLPALFGPYASATTK